MASQQRYQGVYAQAHGTQEAQRVTGSDMTTAANQLQQYQKLLQIQRAHAELRRQQQAANVVTSGQLIHNHFRSAVARPNNIPKRFTKPELIERQRKILEDIEQQKKDEAFARQLEREFQENNEEEDEDDNDDGDISNEEIVFSGSENDEDDNEAAISGDDSDAGEIVFTNPFLDQTEVCYLKLNNYIYFIGMADQDHGLTKQILIFY